MRKKDVKWYRGYNKDTKEWIYGNGVFRFDDKHTQILKFVMGDSETPIYTSHDVDPDTIGEFLLNVDNEQLFEGDVLKITDNIHESYQYVMVERGGWFLYNMDNKGVIVLNILNIEEHLTMEKTAYNVMTLPAKFNLNKIFV